MRAFPYTIEYEHTAVSDIQNIFQTDFDNYSIYDSYEGTLIRMFHFSGKWYLSTHRKLNAFKSKWSSQETFGTAFLKALEYEVENNVTLKKSLPNNNDNLIERFQTTLDPLKQYMFLVLHNSENRIVCNTPTHPTLYHVGTFINNNLYLTENIAIPVPKKHTFSTVDSMIEYVNSIDIHAKQGVIIFAPGNKQYKVVHKDYLYYFNARGNEPSIKFRYLQVRMDKTIVDTLYYLYPSMIVWFEKYEKALSSISHFIYTQYVERFIKKNWVSVPVEEYNVVKQCHSFFLQDRKKNRITLKKVIEILDRQHPTSLNKMIRRFYAEKDSTEKNPEQSQSILKKNNIV
jgi:hypothetical protein